MSSRRASAPRALAAALLLGAGGAAAQHAHGPEAAAPRFEAPAPGTYELPAIARVSGHRMLGHDGAPAPLLELAPGQVGFVSFVYLSCPHACPATHALLQRLDRHVAADARLAGRVQLATISFDPGRDTPARMAELRRALAPRGSWRFLTARDRAGLEPVLADFGQDVLRPPAGSDAALRHVLRVFLVDADGAVRNVYSTGFLDLRLLVNDALTLLGEGSRGE